MDSAWPCTLRSADTQPFSYTNVIIFVMKAITIKTTLPRVVVARKGHKSQHLFQQSKKPKNWTMSLLCASTREK